MLLGTSGFQWPKSPILRLEKYFMGKPIKVLRHKQVCWIWFVQKKCKYKYCFLKRIYFITGHFSYDWYYMIEYIIKTIYWIFIFNAIVSSHRKEVLGMRKDFLGIYKYNKVWYKFVVYIKGYICIRTQNTLTI